MPTFGFAGVTHVAPPRLVPTKGGILDVAEVVPLGAHEIYGVTYESIASLSVNQVTEDPTDCLTVALDSDNFDGLNFVDGESGFAIYTGIECTLVDNTMESFEARAKQRLEDGSSRAVEQHLWTETFAGATDLNAGGAVSLRKGLRLLADYAAANYSYQPMIHFGRGTGVELTAERLLDFDGTLAGLAGQAVDGSGYISLTGPGGVVAAADTAWIYATGQIVVRQGATRTYSATGVRADTAAVTTNALVAIAERPYVVTVDGFTVAVRVTLE